MNISDFFTHWDACRRDDVDPSPIQSNLCDLTYIDPLQGSLGLKQSQKILTLLLSGSTTRAKWACNVKMFLRCRCNLFMKLNKPDC